MRRIGRAVPRKGPRIIRVTFARCRVRPPPRRRDAVRANDRRCESDEPLLRLDLLSMRPWQVRRIATEDRVYV